MPEEIRSRIIPILDMDDLIEERTGAKPGGGYSLIFSLSPKVDDLIEKFGIKCPGGVILITLGTIKHAGSGCFCPAHALLRALTSHLILERGEDVIMDMEAGIEHLGRGVVRQIDAVLVITEPTIRSIEVASKISNMARSLNVKNIFIIVNKIRSQQENDLTVQLLTKHGLKLAISLPFEERLPQLELLGKSVHELPPTSKLIRGIYKLARELIRMESS